MKHTLIGIKSTLLLTLLTLAIPAMAINLTVKKSLPQPQDVGTPIDFTMIPGDYTGSVNYQVRFRGVASNFKWITLNDWSNHNIYQWDSSAYLGFNVFEFKVKSMETGKIASKKVQFYIHDPLNPPATDAIVEITPAIQQYAGINFTLNIQGRHGSGEYINRIKYRSPLTNNQWKTLQSFTDKNPLTFSQLPPSDYEFQIRTKNKGSYDKHVLTHLSYRIMPSTPLNSILLPDFILQQCLLDTALLQGWTLAEEVTHLDCSNKEVIDVSGIEQLNQLRSLDLSGNSLLDPLPLAKLMQLESLNLADNKTLSSATIQPVLEANEKLTALNLSNIKLNYFPALVRSDGKPYAFTELSLMNTELYPGSIDLQAYTTLEKLNLAHNDLTDLNNLQALTNLTTLDVSDNALQQINALSELTQLRSLSLSNNPQLDFINQIEPVILKNEHLQHLSLNNIYIGNEFWPYYKQDGTPYDLISLQLNNAAIQNPTLDFIAPYTNLKVLSVAGNRIHSLQGLMPSVQLHVMDISNNGIIHLQEALHLDQLTHLNLAGNSRLPVTDVKSLITRNGNITWLNVSDIDFSDQPIPLPYDISTFSSGLIRLFADNTQTVIHDLQFLYSVPDLVELSFAGNNLFNLEGLEQLPNLTALNLSDNLLTNIDPLYSINHLIELRLSNNNLLDSQSVSRVIANNPQLEILGISGIHFDGNLPLPEKVYNPKHHIWENRSLRILEANHIGYLSFSLEILANYTQLERLSIKGNQLRSLKGLHEYSWSLPLIELDVSDNLLNDVDALKYERITSLKSLDLSGNRSVNIHDIFKIVDNNQELEVLGISDINFRGFSLPLVNNYLEDKKSLLRQFKANNTQSNFHNLDFLKSMPFLTHLSFAGNNLETLQGLNDAPEIKALDLTNNQLYDISELNYKNNLTELSLSYNTMIPSYSIPYIINANPMLETLGISGIHFNGDIPLPGKPYYPDNQVNDNLTLRTLEADYIGYDAHTLEFLIHYKRLQRLSFKGNRLQSLKGLIDDASHGVPSLVELDVSDNELTNISTLLSYRTHKLKALDLSGNSAINVHDIYNIVNNNRQLETLGISNINFSGLPLPGLEPYLSENVSLLRVLKADNTQASSVNLNFLTAVPHLTHLSFRENKLETLQGLDNAPAIVSLNLANNRLHNITSLNHKHNLIELNLSNNNSLTDLSIYPIINNNEQLEILGISSIDFNGYFPLSENDSFPDDQIKDNRILRILEADNIGYQGYTLKALTNYKQLTHLSFQGNQLRTLEGLYNDHLPSPLVDLNVSNNELEDISALELNETRKLKRLVLSGNNRLKAYDIYNLVKQNQRLEYLDISKIDLKDYHLPIIDPLLPSPIQDPYLSSKNNMLKIFKADYTQVRLTDLAFLNTMPYLTHLSFQGNNLQTLKGLDKSVNIKALNLASNQLLDISALEFKNNLTELNLSNNTELNTSLIERIVNNNSTLEVLDISNIDFNGYLPLPGNTYDPEFQQNINQTLHTFKADNIGYTEGSLRPFEYFTNLERLSFRGNQLQTLDGLPISHYQRPSSLVELDVSDNDLLDINQLLTGMDQLQLLSVSGNDQLDCLSLLELVNSYPNLSMNPPEHCPIN